MGMCYAYCLTMEYTEKPLKNFRVLRGYKDNNCPT